MPKSKNTKTSKPRADKYEKPLQVKASFMDIMKVVVKDANTKDKK